MRPPSSWSWLETFSSLDSSDLSPNRLDLAGSVVKELLDPIKNDNYDNIYPKANRRTLLEALYWFSLYLGKPGHLIRLLGTYRHRMVFHDSVLVTSTRWALHPWGFLGFSRFAWHFKRTLRSWSRGRSQPRVKTIFSCVKASIGVLVNIGPGLVIGPRPHLVHVFRASTASGRRGNHPRVLGLWHWRY